MNIKQNANELHDDRNQALQLRRDAMMHIPDHQINHYQHVRVWTTLTRGQQKEPNAGRTQRGNEIPQRVTQIHTDKSYKR
eukprot:3992070-Amphidinium_carterae.1